MVCTFITNHEKWKNQVDQTILKVRVCGAFYVVRSMFHISTTTTLKKSYLFYFHFVMKYGIFLERNSLTVKNMFTLRKKTLRIMVGKKRRIPRWNLSKRLHILLIPCKYIRSLMDCTVNNQENFQTNSVAESITTGNKHHSNRPTANLLSSQKIDNTLASECSTVHRENSQVWRTNRISSNQH